MPANRIQLQNALHKPYDRVLFSREVLSPVFGSGFTLNSSLVPAVVLPSKSESAAIDKVWIYGNIQLDDSTEITCYEVLLQPKVRIEQSKVAIQQYVRKLLTAGQAALINFVAPANKNVWRLTLVAKDSVLTDKGVKEKTTNAKRYTFLLGPSETCKTAAERFEVLSTESKITFQTLINAFSVEKLSKAFFDEYTLHYQNFCDYLQESNYRKSVFNITFPADATKHEKDKASKPIRDFVKKLLGRIVFLYFVQKKGWLGASDTNYTDGLGDFIKQLFNKSGGNETFYSNWLTVLFFDTLNKERTNDDFTMPDGKTVKVPFLNGGLFDKEEFDEHLLTFTAKLFHNPDFEDTILTEKSKGNARGFLDFLDAFNFTIYEDSPDDHTVAVDPEMLGHIFENLLEDNKDKGAFYTPKEIVHYMCQESLTEYLCTALQIKDEVTEREAVNHLLKNKVVDDILKPEIAELEKALDNVKICDPAIGSGAFPMGLLQEIFSIKELIAYETGKEWKPAETKLNIIQNSIYGVDIEKGAVDIARLRFWLSLVVDEEKPKPLPNLDYKIVVGDSLISKFDGEIVEIDWERKSSVGKADEYVKNVQRLLVEVADKQKLYFSPNNKNKKKLQAEIRNLKIELLINQLSFNKELYVSKTEQKGGFMPTTADIKHNTERALQIRGFDNLIDKLKYLLKNPDEPFNHFDWKLDFPEVLNPYLVNGNGGFDIVIGNPPYVSFGLRGVNKMTDEDKAIYNKKYSNSAEYKISYYAMFMELAIKIANSNGVSTLIVPDSFLLGMYFSKIRGFILDKSIIKFINLYTYKIFGNATVGFSVIYLNRNKENPTRNNDLICSLISSRDMFLKGDYPCHTLNTSYYRKQDRTRFRLFFSKEDEELVNRIESNSIWLSEFYTGRTGIRSKIGQKNILTKEKINRKYLPVLTSSSQVKKFKIIYDNDYVHLEPKLLNSGGWEYDIINNPKILIPQTGDKITAAIDRNCYYHLNNIHSFAPHKKGLELQYVCAILNSNLINWYYKKISLEEDRAMAQIDIETAEKLPIIVASKQYQIQVSHIVDYLHFINSIESINFDTLIINYFEQIIDGMVYELYFPELLKKHNREIIKYLGELPEFTDGMNDEQKMMICKNVFERLNDKEHPVRVNLEKMKEEIKEIRIIEGLE